VVSPQESLQKLHKYSKYITVASRRIRSRATASTSQVNKLCFSFSRRKEKTLLPNTVIRSSCDIIKCHTWWSADWKTSQRHRRQSYACSLQQHYFPRKRHKFALTINFMSIHCESRCFSAAAHMADYWTVSLTQRKLLLIMLQQETREGVLQHFKGFKYPRERCLMWFSLNCNKEVAQIGKRGLYSKSIDAPSSIAINIGLHQKIISSHIMWQELLFSELPLNVSQRNKAHVLRIAVCAGNAWRIFTPSE